MVAHFTMRTYGVNQEFRFAEGIWLHRKSRQVRVFFRKRPFLHHTCATCFEQPSHMKTHGWWWHRCDFEISGQKGTVFLTFGRKRLCLAHSGHTILVKEKKAP